MGPLNVVGVEEGALCEAGQTQTVMCTLDKNQTASRFGPPQLTGFTMRTTNSNGSQVQSLPISGNLARFLVRCQPVRHVNLPAKCRQVLLQRQELLPGPTWPS